MDKQELIDQAIEGAILAIREGQRILIVGVRSTNLPAEYYEDARLYVWSKSGSEMKRMPAVPIDVGVVLYTRYLNHYLTDHLGREADRLGIDIFGTFETGQLKLIVNRALGIAEESVPDDEAEDTTPEIPVHDFSGLSDFLIGEIPTQSLEYSLLSDEEEMQRLHDLAESRFEGISLSRVRRALQEGLERLGVHEVISGQSEGADVDSRKLPSESRASEVSSELESARREIAKLKNKLAKLRGKYSRLKGRERKLSTELESTKKDRDEAVERLKAMLDVVEQGGAMIIAMRRPPLN